MKPSEIQAPSPSSLGSSWSVFFFVVIVLSVAAQIAPDATAKAASAATPSPIPATSRVVPTSCMWNSTTGSRSMASPTTPPSPDGSGQCAERGRHDTKAALNTAPKIHNSTRRRSSGEPPVAKQPITPYRDRQQQRQRAEPEKLHHQIGGDGARHAEQIVHRRIGGVAQRRVLHRPARQRQRRHHGETDQRDPHSSRSRRRKTVPRWPESAAMPSRLRSIIDIASPLPPFSRAPRRGDASPPR